jgi:hypothetical protein
MHAHRAMISLACHQKFSQVLSTWPILRIYLMVSRVVVDIAVGLIPRSVVSAGPLRRPI